MAVSAEISTTSSKNARRLQGQEEQAPQQQLRITATQPDRTVSGAKDEEKGQGPHDPRQGPRTPQHLCGQPDGQEGISDAIGDPSALQIRHSGQQQKRQRYEKHGQSIPFR